MIRAVQVRDLGEGISVKVGPHLDEGTFDFGPVDRPDQSAIVVRSTVAPELVPEISTSHGWQLRTGLDLAGDKPRSPTTREWRYRRLRHRCHGISIREAVAHIQQRQLDGRREPGPRVNIHGDDEVVLIWQEGPAREEPHAHNSSNLMIGIVSERAPNVAEERKHDIDPLEVRVFDPGTSTASSDDGWSSSLN